MTESYVNQAIHAVLSGRRSYCKFLSANDAGATGSNQAGILVSKSVGSMLFSEALGTSSIMKRSVKICWQDDFETESNFTYYDSKNELRITKFGRGFPLLRPEYTGALFVLVQNSSDDYQGYVLNTEDEIDQFLDAFGISSTETNCFIHADQITAEAREKVEFDTFISSLTEDFPASGAMSAAARFIQDKIYNHAEYALTNPDRKLLDWTAMEYKLFRAIEQARYGDVIANGFSSVEEFINTANAVLNRRKSRAGKSLEHHLSAIFTKNRLLFKEQAVTEGNKKPDFIFPSQEAYHDLAFPADRLASLAAKTTCKDRWRQIINEADRLRGRPKYLCTLQQGISSAQMDEMQEENVILVVPRPYISSYPADRRERIWTVAKFVNYIREVEGV